MYILLSYKYQYINTKYQVLKYEKNIKGRYKYERKL